MFLVPSSFQGVDISDTKSLLGVGIQGVGISRGGVGIQRELVSWGWVLTLPRYMVHGIPLDRVPVVRNWEK